MAVTVVRTAQGGDTSNGTTTVITVGASGHAQGNHLILQGYRRSVTSGQLVTSVVDSRGNTWQIDRNDASATSGAYTASAYLATALQSGDTITVTYAGTVGGRSYILREVNGLVSVSWLDVAATAGSSNSNPSVTPSITPSAGDRFLCALHGDQSNVTVSSVASGWNQDGTRQQISGPTAVTTISRQATYDGTTAETSGAITFSAGVSQGRQHVVPYKLAAAVAPASTVAPAVTGNARVGQVLTSDNGSWNNSPTSYAYQWQRDVAGNGSYSNIGGATASTRTVQSADQGCNLRCVVTATNAAGSTSANSNAVGKVANIYSPAQGKVELRGEIVAAWVLPTLFSPDDGVIEMRGSVRVKGLGKARPRRLRIGITLGI